MRRALAAAALALAAVVAMAAPAAAHASVVSTSPSAGARLATAPGTVAVTFDGRVTARPDALRVHDSRGGRVATGRLRREDGGRTLVVGLPALDEGGYVTTWRVVSADGHPVGGAVTWRVGTAGGQVSTTLLQDLLSSANGQESVAAAAAVARVLLFSGLVVLLGGWAVLALLWPQGADDRRARRLLWGGLIAAAAGTVAGLGLEAADFGGFGLLDALRPSVIGDALGTDFARASIVRVVVLAFSAVVLARTSVSTVTTRLLRSAAAGCGVALLLTVTLAGHARTGRWTAVAIPLDLVHLSAGTFWLGGLTLLAVATLRPSTSEAAARAVVTRFSPLAFGAVAVLAATGTAQGFRQLGRLGALQDTNYGRLLIVKVVAVAILLSVAGMSRSLLRGGDTVAALRRSVAAEAAIGVAVIVVTSLLVAADPSRATGDTAFAATKLVDDTTISVVVAPARTGPVDVHVYVANPSAGLTAPREATGSLSLPSKGIAGLDLPFVFAGADHFSANDVEVPIRGTWVLDVIVRIGETDERTATFDVPID